MGSLCDSTVYHSLRSPFIVHVVHAGHNSCAQFFNATIFSIQFIFQGRSVYAFNFISHVMTYECWLFESNSK